MHLTDRDLSTGTVGGGGGGDGAGGGAARREQDALGDAGAGVKDSGAAPMARMISTERRGQTGWGPKGLFEIQTWCREGPGSRRIYCA